MSPSKVIVYQMVMIFGEIGWPSLRGNAVPPLHPDVAPCRPVSPEGAGGGDMTAPDAGSGDVLEACFFAHRPPEHPISLNSKGKTMLDTTHVSGTTADVISVVRLTPMNAGTRVHTITSVRALREHLTGGPEMSAEAFFQVIDSPMSDLRSQLGPRHVQIISDVGRAKRAWSDPFRRDLVLRMRGQLPTLKDAQEAAQASYKSDQAKRTIEALHQLALSRATTADNIIATAVVIEPLLRTLIPEDLGVHTAKSLSNKISQIRAAVKLVDPNAISGRQADVKGLPEVWQALLKELLSKVPDHAKSVKAVLRRLALSADRDALLPRQVHAAFLKNFVAYEAATKSDSHKEKLRSAGRIWNEEILRAGLEAARFQLAGDSRRLPDVAWKDVPEGIRARMDALTDRMVAPQGEEDWSSFIEDTDDLGLGDLTTSPAASEGKIPREPGTQRNLRNAVKRVWHAAQTDPAVKTKPQQLEDLFRQDCLLATIGAIRKKRQGRVDAKGQKWDDHKKGRYECSLVQALYSVGKSCALTEDILEPVRALTLKLDPSIVGSKVKPDGKLRYIYEERKIGKHHESMLRQFNEASALSRWFKAPQVLWAQAEKWAREGKKAPTLAQAALARSAVIAQLEHRVTPMRRANLARLRAFGDERHLSLPIGAGEGTLILPAAEMKNLRSVYVSIDPETVRMLQRFIAIYRPVFAKNANAHPENEHLFPGAADARKEHGETGGYAAGFGYMTKEKLCQRFREHIWKHCQLRMDLQVMRHIAGKVILDMDPSAMGLVQEVLGHKRIETTMSYYAEVSKIIAQKNYLQLLDQYTRRVVSHVDFRIEIEQEKGD